MIRWPLPSDLGRLASVLQRATPRERWLSAIGLAAVVGTLAWEASSWASAQRVHYETASADLALAQQARANRLQGAPTVAQIEALQQVRGLSQRGRTFWLARLGIEQRIVLAAWDAGLKDTQVRLAEAPEGEKALPLVRAEISGPYRRAGFIGMLQRLSWDHESYVVDKLEVKETDAPAFKLALLFPIEVDAGGRP